MLVIYVIIFVISLFLTMGFNESYKQTKETWDLILYYIWLITDFAMFICIIKIIFGI